MGNLEISREARPRIYESTFEEWINEGCVDAAGVIDIVNASGSGAFIKPLAFPEERLYFSTGNWSVEDRRKPLDGRRVVFNVMAQEVPRIGKPIASKIRPQGFTPRGE